MGARLPKPSERRAPSEAEGRGDEGPIHVDGEAGEGSLVVEVQTTEPGVQGRPMGDLVVDSPHGLPIDLGAAGADVAISRGAEAMAQVVMIAGARQHVAPGLSAGNVDGRKQ